MPRGFIEPQKADKRLARRDKEGRFSMAIDLGKPLAADHRTKAETGAKKTGGDRDHHKR